MSVAISNFGAELLVVGNVLCNVFIACYSCFLYRLFTKSQSFYK